MTPHVMVVILVCLGTTFGGWLLVGAVMFAVRRTTMKSTEGAEPFSWGTFWVGLVERAIATSLVIWAPNLVPAFIGGWTVLKVAASWSRSRNQRYGAGEVSALVGTALSFAVAVFFGLLLNPGALVVWSKSTAP